MERCGIHPKEVSDEEEEFAEEAKPPNDIHLVRMFKSILQVSSRP